MTDWLITNACNLKVTKLLLQHGAIVAVQDIYQNSFRRARRQKNKYRDYCHWDLCCCYSVNKSSRRQMEVLAVAFCRSVSVLLLPDMPCVFIHHFTLSRGCLSKLDIGLPICFAPCLFLSSLRIRVEKYAKCLCICVCVSVCVCCVQWDVTLIKTTPLP